MNFSPYQAQGQGTAPIQNYIDPIRVSYNNRGEQALVEANSKLYGVVMHGVNAYIQQRNVAEVMEANNFYNRRMSEEMERLSQKKEGAALNIVEEYDAASQKVRDQVNKKYRKYLFGEQGKALVNTVERDDIAKRNQMVNYQIAETEKYKTTQYGNELEDIGRNLTMAYSDPATVAYCIDKARTVATAFSFNRGDEAIKQARNKAVTYAVTTAMDAAVANEDWATVNNLYQKYGNNLNVAAKNQWSKTIYARQQADTRITTYRSIYRPGMTEKEFMDNIRAGLGNFAYDNSSLLRYAEKHIGENVGVNNNCTTFVNQCLTANGYKPIALYAPNQFDDWQKAEQEGYFIRDRSQLRDGDIVYQDVDGEEGSGGRLDPDHVGIYRASDNTIIQSGVSGGVQYIPADTYKVLGFIHPEKVELTPGQQEEEMVKAQAYYRKQDSQYKAEQSQAISNGRDSMYMAYFNNPAITADELKAMAIQTGGGNTRVTAQLLQYAVTLGRAASRGSGNGKYDKNGLRKLDANDKAAIEGKLADGETDEDGLRAMMAKEPVDPSATQWIEKTINDYKNGAGVFSYDWGALKQEVTAANPIGRQDATLWENAQNVVLRDIAQYRKENKGVDPPKEWVKTKLNDALARRAVYTKTGMMWNSTAEYSPAQLDRKGIENVADRGNGTYFVKPVGGFPITLTAEQLDEVMNSDLGMQLFRAKNDGKSFLESGK